jgi:hypothetical protein
VYNDLQAIAPEQYFKQITKRLAEIKAVSVSRKSSCGVHVRFAYNATYQWYCCHLFILSLLIVMPENALITKNSSLGSCIPSSLLYETHIMFLLASHIYVSYVCSWTASVV